MALRVSVQLVPCVWAGVFSPWQTHRTLCVGSAVLASQLVKPLVMCVWPGSGHLTAAANQEPGKKNQLYINLIKPPIF